MPLPFQLSIANFLKPLVTAYFAFFFLTTSAISFRSTLFLFFSQKDKLNGE